MNFAAFCKASMQFHRSMQHTQVVDRAPFQLYGTTATFTLGTGGENRENDRETQEKFSRT